MHDVAHRLHLGAQLVGHRRAIGLVLRVEVIAEGAAGGIDHVGDEFGRSARVARSMLTTPNSAPVGSPTSLVSGGRAWKAR